MRFNPPSSAQHSLTVDKHTPKLTQALMLEILRLIDRYKIKWIHDSGSMN